MPQGHFSIFIGDPNEVRTRVPAVRGRCPRPLDDGTSKRQEIYNADYENLQAFFLRVQTIICREKLLPRV